MNKSGSDSRSQSVIAVRDFVGGEWVDSFAKRRADVLNPATGLAIGSCPMGGEEDVKRAVNSAHRAFQTWKRVPVVERIQYLFKFKGLLEAHAEELALMVTRENGKTLVESRGSVKRGIQMVETATGMPVFQQGEFLEDIARGIDCLTIKKPLGVFAGIAPFNFPAMVPFWFWPFAIASGNTYVLKPSERVPLTHQLIFDLIKQTGLPPGVLNLLNGGKEIVESLCIHPQVQGVSFVGSSPVAKGVYTLANAHGKRVQALGGAKNFMVVLADAVLDQAVPTALESIVGCAGQRCLAGSVVICVGDATYQQVRDKIKAAASDISVGNGEDPQTQMGPVISQTSKDRICALIQGAQDEGAKIDLDGRKGVETMPGFFLRPTVISEVTPEMRVSKEEIFGPVVVLARVNTLDEAVHWINSSQFANTATLFTSNGEAARRFASEVEPSMVGINIGVPAPMSFFSFGGKSASFYGDIKAHGPGAVDFFTDKRTVTQRWVAGANVW